MDWIEISANSLEKAKIDASARLGVAAEDIEIVVLESRNGLLNRILHHNVRIRARIKPLEALPIRRNVRGAKRNPTAKSTRGKEGARQLTKQDNAVKNKDIARENVVSSKTKKANSKERNSPQHKTGRSANRKAAVKDNTIKESMMNNDTNENQTTENNVPISDEALIREQAEQISRFLSGLCNVMGLKVQSRITAEDGVYIVELSGDNLGVLIGHHGTVFNAVQDISRTVVRTASNQPPAGVLIDIANYRSKRTAALTNFAVKQAQRVLETQKQIILENMNSAERKIIHEAVKDTEGVSTRSEGVEPNRVVVIFVDNTGNVSTDRSSINSSINGENSAP